MIPAICSYSKMDCVMLLNYLEDGLVWGPMKDVPSCEKPWGGAWNL